LRKRAGVFKRALKRLSFDLEQKIEAQKQPHLRRLGFNTHNESVAKLSRMSLAFSDRIIHEPCSEKRIDDAVNILAEGGSRAIPFGQSSVVSLMADLTHIAEESPEEIIEAGEPPRSDALLPDAKDDTAHGTFYSQGESDIVAAPAYRAPSSASTQADPVPAQILRVSRQPGQLWMLRQ